MYSDESGIELTIFKDRRLGRNGIKLIGKKSVKYDARTNIIAIFVNNKSIAPMIFNGSSTAKVFEMWGEHLIKKLKPGKGVVMDIAAFHRSKKTKDLIESVGCKVIFLLSYSPDLNPIEKFLVNMKRWIKCQINAFGKLYEAISAFFQIPSSG
ncbi:transposase [Holospora undulata]|nr:transposase [Holospora undulata]